MEAVNVYYRNIETDEWDWIAECCNDFVAKATAEYWSQANSGDVYAYGKSAMDICEEFCR